MMDDTLEFQIGDCVLYLLDGDIGVVTDVDYAGEEGANQPYYIKWYIDPQASGWHSAHHNSTGERVLARLGV